jgi:hypothetical protein
MFRRHPPSEPAALLRAIAQDIGSVRCLPLQPIGDPAETVCSSRKTGSERCPVQGSANDLVRSEKQKVQMCKTGSS